MYPYKKYCRLPVAVLALKKSAQAMLLLFLGLPIALVVVASAVFFAEQTVQTFDKDAHVWTRDADGYIFDTTTTSFTLAYNAFEQIYVTVSKRTDNFLVYNCYYDHHWIWRCRTS